MTRAYTRSRDAAGALDGSFRLFSLIQNVGTERERQRALLLAWENTLLYALTAEDPGPAQPLLISRSEFGLWFLHKGLASFGDTAETREVNQLAERIDTALRERLPTGDVLLYTGYLSFQPSPTRTRNENATVTAVMSINSEILRYPASFFAGS